MGSGIVISYVSNKTIEVSENDYKLFYPGCICTCNYCRKYNEVKLLPLHAVAIDVNYVSIMKKSKTKM